MFFVRAQDARAERQAEGAVQVIERRQLTVLWKEDCECGTKVQLEASKVDTGRWPSRSRHGSDLRRPRRSIVSPRSAIDLQTTDQRLCQIGTPAAPMTPRARMAPANTTARTQAGSSARLVATAIGRCSSEGQPLVALDCQPSLPRGAEELFCDSLRTSWIHASFAKIRATNTC